MNNGVNVYSRRPAIRVIAIDVKSGNLLWRYKKNRPSGSDGCCISTTSRGVALYGDKVYFALGTAVLVALDAKTGKEVWSTPVADNKSAYYISLAPLIAGGKVMVGASGGEFGVRGFVAAFDPESGARYSGAPHYRFPRRASRAAKPGRRVATSGRPAAVQCG